ncbi:tmcA [Symbiodinium natans]|uniref:TmcA protein n=1 Tax=Symbiodinium natans TaxID=878477 RepID=A0A812SK60_9DINO|nr:tmcA [Symbiodinium natans]
MLPAVHVGFYSSDKIAHHSPHIPHKRCAKFSRAVAKPVLASLLASAACVHLKCGHFAARSKALRGRRPCVTFCKPAELQELPPRKLVVISGTPSWTEKVGREALEVMEARATRSGRKLRALIAYDFRADKPPPASEWMGQEIDAALLSVQRLNFLDTFGAVCGALRGGGVLLLCTPELDNWKASSSAGRRWCREIETLASESYAASASFISQQTWQTSDLAESLSSVMPVWPKGTKLEMAATADQQRIIEAVLQTSSASPLLISGRRGRGKSAALGLAATVLLRRGCEKILVTSPSIESTRQLFDSAERAARSVSTELRVSRKDSGTLEVGQVGCLTFVSISQLLGSTGHDLLRSCQYLFVDEAAGIPVAEARRLLMRTRRVVMATTLDGYEGSGQGFLLRALPALQKTKRDLRHIQLTTPLRWRAGWVLSGLCSIGQVVMAEVVLGCRCGQSPKADVLTCLQLVQADACMISHTILVSDNDELRCQKEH